MSMMRVTSRGPYIGLHKRDKIETSIWPYWDLMFSLKWEDGNKHKLVVPSMH